MWFHLLDDLGYSGVSPFDPHANAAMAAWHVADARGVVGMGLPSLNRNMLERLDRLLIKYSHTPPINPRVLEAVQLVRVDVWEKIEAITRPHPRA